MYFTKITKKELKRITPDFDCLLRGIPPVSSLIFVFLIIFPLSSPAKTLQISSNTTVATAGYYQLSWSVPTNNPTFSVEESNSATFDNTREIYRGKDYSSTLSGKMNGEYFYRVRTLDTPDWSDSVKVTVAHHSLVKAFLFFALGFFVFASTVYVIIRNYRN